MGNVYKIDKQFDRLIKYDDKNNNNKIDPGETVASLIFSDSDKNGKFDNFQVKGDVSVFATEELKGDLATRVYENTSTNVISMDDKNNRMKIQQGKEYSLGSLATSLDKMAPAATTNTVSKTVTNVNPTIDTNSLNYIQQVGNAWKAPVQGASMYGLISGDPTLYETTVTNFMNSLLANMNKKSSTSTVNDTSATVPATDTQAFVEDTSVPVPDKRPIIKGSPDKNSVSNKVPTVKVSPDKNAGIKTNTKKGNDNKNEDTTANQKLKEVINSHITLLRNAYKNGDYSTVSNEEMELMTQFGFTQTQLNELLAIPVIKEIHKAENEQQKAVKAKPEDYLKYQNDINEHADQLKRLKVDPKTINTKTSNEDLNKIENNIISDIVKKDTAKAGQLFDQLHTEYQTLDFKNVNEEKMTLMEFGYTNDQINKTIGSKLVNDIKAKQADLRKLISKEKKSDADNKNIKRLTNEIKSLKTQVRLFGIKEEDIK